MHGRKFSQCVVASHSRCFWRTPIGSMLVGAHTAESELSWYVVARASCEHIPQEAELALAEDIIDRHTTLLNVANHVAKQERKHTHCHFKK